VQDGKIQFEACARDSANLCRSRSLQIESREKWMRIWPLGAERRGRRCIKFNLAARAHTYIVK